MLEHITIKGARMHNLKNITVSLPRNKLIVITGMSGSGKSSLAFDTIYAEGQRRYVESLSAYARQFLEQMDKPDVDTIEGLSPAVSVEQKSVSHNPRSTVGTVTEIYDYLRLLMARVGKPFCYKCGRVIERQGIEQIVERLLQEFPATRVQILAPVVEVRKGEHAKELERLKSLGFGRVKVDDTVYELTQDIDLDKKKKHSIDVIIDRLKIEKDSRSRLHESLETAFHMGTGVAKAEFLNEGRKAMKTELLSVNNACTRCGVSYPQIEPQMFSFNSPQGACEHCDGLGELMSVDELRVVPNENLSIDAGAIVPWYGKKTNYYQSLLIALSKSYNFSLNTPFKDLSAQVRRIIFDGASDYIRIKNNGHEYTGFFEGVKSNIMRRYKETESDWMRGELVRFMSYLECPSCHGARLKTPSLFIRLNDKNIADLTALSLRGLAEFFDGVRFSSVDREIAAGIVKEIGARLKFLLNVGLDYISLDRKSHTLSGGEAQRIRLATQIGSALVGVTYVLDEPSVGLHQRDNDRLIATLKGLRDVGNTVLVVEHDEDTILNADHVLDLGPRAGVHGGEVVYSGPVAGLKGHKASLTGAYLNGEQRLPVPRERRKKDCGHIILSGARANNLKDITVTFPLGKLICVTGVSGSGKSTLVNDTLGPVLTNAVYDTRHATGKFKEVLHTTLIDKVIDIDQSPIGRTPRSNPATYTGLFTHIRDLFSLIPDAKARGYRPGRFSFNVKGGRCDACEGDGFKRISMHFLPDVFVRCETCGGKRFNAETLSIYYKGKNIDEVLKMTLEEALVFFKNIPPIARKCETLHRVGLGYIQLGQAATTLSGGEAQRIKLARELSKRSTGRTFYILDEPTTGLHFEDVRLLMEVLQELVDQGNTVLVIEHNMHVIKQADHIIDLGPEGGDGGGQIVATGTPEAIACVKASHTGRFLKRFLKE